MKGEFWPTCSRIAPDRTGPTGRGSASGWTCCRSVGARAVRSPAGSVGIRRSQPTGDKNRKNTVVFLTIMLYVLFTRCWLLFYVKFENFALQLKVHLHEIFYFCFFSLKAPTWSPDSYLKFVSNIKSNLPRYSNYSSLCVDSVNAELIFCFKL